MEPQRLNKVLEKLLENAEVLYEKRREIRTRKEFDTEEYIKFEREYASEGNKIESFLNIINSSGIYLSPDNFDKYASITTKILEEIPFSCYKAGLTWSDPNFNKYADSLAKGLMKMPKLCYKMLCDYNKVDPASMDENILDQLFRESFLSSEPWNNKRIERIYTNLFLGLDQDEKLSKKYLKAFLHKRLVESLPVIKEDN